jgi:hypothetical protein
MATGESNFPVGTPSESRPVADRGIAAPRETGRRPFEAPCRPLRADPGTARKKSPHAATHSVMTRRASVRSDSSLRGPSETLAPPQSAGIFGQLGLKGAACGARLLGSAMVADQGHGRGKAWADTDSIRFLRAGF